MEWAMLIAGVVLLGLVILAYERASAARNLAERAFKRAAEAKSENSNVAYTVQNPWGGAASPFTQVVEPWLRRHKWRVVAFWAAWLLVGLHLTTGVI